MDLDEMPVERPLQILLILRLVGTVMGGRRLHLFQSWTGCAFGFNRDVAHPLSDAECRFFHGCGLGSYLRFPRNPCGCQHVARFAFLFVTAASTILGLNHREIFGTLPCPDRGCPN